MWSREPHAPLVDYQPVGDRTEQHEQSATAADDGYERARHQCGQEGYPYQRHPMWMDVKEFVFSVAAWL